MKKIKLKVLAASLKLPPNFEILPGTHFKDPKVGI
jgi:hypothetical protein